jgi:hypothetical protein
MGDKVAGLVGQDCPQNETVTLRCAACGLPWARLQNGVLMVQSKHHGEKHVNGIAVTRLVELCHEGAEDHEQRRFHTRSRGIEGRWSALDG